MAAIDARLQYDEYKEVIIIYRPSRPPIVVVGCSTDNISCVTDFVCLRVPTLCDEVPRCVLYCQIINAGEVNLGETL